MRGGDPKHPWCPCESDIFIGTALFHIYRAFSRKRVGHFLLGGGRGWLLFRFSDPINNFQKHFMIFGKITLSFFNCLAMQAVVPTCSCQAIDSFKTKIIYRPVGILNFYNSFDLGWSGERERVIWDF